MFNITCPNVLSSGYLLFRELGENTLNLCRRCKVKDHKYEIVMGKKEMKIKKLQGE